MNRTLLTLLAVVGAALFIATQCIFFVDESQRAVVLQLGEAVEEEAREPGINFKLPFIQSVVYFEDRILVFEIEKTESLTADLKVLEIDNYVCWRIRNPIVFYRNLRSEQVATDRLRNIVYSQLRAAMGSNTLNDMVFSEPLGKLGQIPAPDAGSAKSASVDAPGAEGEKNPGVQTEAVEHPDISASRRSAIMEEVLRKSDGQAAQYGVTVVDVRIKRMDLPNRQAIINRMNAERLRMANKYRFEGESENLRIRSEAERQRDSTLADANRESIVIRGQADAKVIEIFAEALSVNPEFYEFSKSLEVYQKAFSERTRIILSDDDPLLNFLK